LTNLTSATPLLSITNVTVPSNSSPQRSAQSTNGFTLDTIDGRIFNANWRAGHLTGAHTIQSGNSIAVRWYDIATNNWPTSGTPTLNQSGNILIGGQDNHMGVATSNSLGDIAVCYTRSSSSITADLMYAARKSGDPAGTLGAPVLLENSAGHSYSGGRWGDYFGIDVDPVDEATFWGVGMDIASDNNWKTSIFSWQITAPGTDVLPTSLAMEHGSILSGGVGQLGISDDDRVQFQAAAVASVAAFDIVADIGGVAQNTNPTSLQVIVESQSPDSNISQRVELKNQDNGQWEIIDERAVTVGTDGSVTLTISTNPGRFIDGSGNILARLSFKSTQPPAHYPWTTRVDRFIWRTTP
jgi:hypothetical protein